MTLIDLFEKDKERRWRKALSHLADSYAAHLDAEQATLQALIQIEKREQNMSKEEAAITETLRRRAAILESGAKRMRTTMSLVAHIVDGYSDSSGSSESSSD